MKKLDVVKKEQRLSRSRRIQSMQILGQRERPFSNKKSKINPFVAESHLESNCKRFRQKALENSNLEPETPLKKTHSNNGGNKTNQYNEAKEKL